MSVAFNTIDPCAKCGEETNFVEADEPWLSGHRVCPACGYAEEDIDLFDEAMAKDD